VRPDPLDLRDTPFRPGVANALALELFPSLLPQVKDQGASNACTGFALATAIEILLQRSQREPAPSISAFMLYNMARRFDEVQGNEDVDVGSSVRGALKGWHRFGACMQALWPEEPMPSATNDPDTDWWLDAVKRPLGAYYRVDAQNLGHVQSALTETQVLYACAAWHPGWEAGFAAGEHEASPRSFAEVWEIPYAGDGAAADSGHAFVVLGYNARGLLIQSSWGRRWGSGGLALLTYRDWLANAMDCWAVQLGVPTEEHAAIARAPSLRYTARVGVAIASAPLLAEREISPFIIDMENDGELSTTGVFRTQDDDLRALTENHLPHAVQAWGLAADQPIDLAIYAHGGTNSEADAYQHAARWVPRLYAQQVFPVFLMWECDIWSSLKQILEDTLRGEPPLAGAGSDPLASLGVRKWLNSRTERVVARPGMPIWQETRGNAIAIGRNPQSGARKLTALLRNSPLFARLRVHLIAHSAGAIAQTYLTDAMVAEGWKIESVTFMAPAARVDDFEACMRRSMDSGAVGRYFQFHLSDEQENLDGELAPWYGRSLLYLVSEAFEGGAARPMLGMERYFSTYLSANVSRQLEICAAPGTLSRAASHSAFPRDATTLDAVLNYIKPARPVS
jgi:hypothetical protein